jgi:tyrosine aminotransferase
MAVNDPVESMAQAKAAAAAAPSKPWQSIKMSSRVARIGNPIREVIAGIDLNAPPSLSGSGNVKPLINLGLGDPSVYGNFPPPSVALDAIEAAVRWGKADGYPQVRRMKICR